MTHGPTEVIEHEHGDVAGGWLRPAVFGAMDGLVSNFALIAGVAGGVGSGPRSQGGVGGVVASAHRAEGVLASIAGLAAGAFSMAAGEYTSVASQSEYTRAEIE